MIVVYAPCNTIAALYFYTMNGCLCVQVPIYMKWLQKGKDIPRFVVHICMYSIPFSIFKSPFHRCVNENSM